MASAIGMTSSWAGCMDNSMSTITLTSTTTTLWYNWPKVFVTITTSLLDPALASYPDPWMTATGVELSSLNALRPAPTLKMGSGTFASASNSPTLASGSATESSSTLTSLQLPAIHSRRPPNVQAVASIFPSTTTSDEDAAYVTTAFVTSLATPNSEVALSIDDAETGLLLSTSLRPNGEISRKTDQYMQFTKLSGQPSLGWLNTCHNKPQILTLGKLFSTNNASHPKSDDEDQKLNTRSGDATTNSWNTLYAHRDGPVTSSCTDAFCHGPAQRSRAKDAPVRSWNLTSTPWISETDNSILRSASAFPTEVVVISSRGRPDTTPSTTSTAQFLPTFHQVSANLYAEATITSTDRNAKRSVHKTKEGIFYHRHLSSGLIFYLVGSIFTALLVLQFMSRFPSRRRGPDARSYRAMYI